MTRLRESGAPTPGPPGASGPSEPVLVILAAGASERLGEPKALAGLRATSPATPLDLLLDAGRGLTKEPAIVVTGAHHDAITRALAEGPTAQPPTVVHNPHWQAGRTGSVSTAARAAPGRDLCIAPVDVPLVPTTVFRTLRDAWRNEGAPATGWLAPAVRRAPGGEPRHGHPVLLGRELAAELPHMAPDAPLRDLRAQASPLLSAWVDDPSILDDLDDAADLAALRARLLAGRPDAD